MEATDATRWANESDRTVNAMDACGDLARRLAIAREELALARQYDYLVVNDRIEQAVEALRAIVIAERCRVRRGSGAAP